MATWTQEDIDRLKAAIDAGPGTGVLKVEYAGPPARSITYQSLADMNATLTKMTAEVVGAKATTHRRAVFNKGFGRTGRFSFRRNE